MTESVQSNVLSSPRVSVVVAAYNYGRFLAQAIESVLQQEDYPADAIEIIVVDDGSTDGTPWVVQPYLERIRYVRKENGGLLSTVNRGLAEATGEFITFVSADDIALPRLIRTEVDLLLARAEVGLVYSDLRIIDGEGACVSPSFFATSGITPTRGRVYGELLKGNFVSGGGMMVRASLRERFHPIPPEAVWEDWWIALRIADVAAIDVIAEPLYGYRRHGSNMNLGSSGRDHLELVRSELPFRRWLLVGVEPGQATPAELVAAVRQFDSYARSVAQHLGLPLGEVLPTGVSESCAAKEAHVAAEAALAAGDVQTGVCRLVNAIAHDPLTSDPRATLERLLAGTAPNALASLRTFAVVAYADEIVEHPELLRAWSATFGEAEDATLVLYAPGADTTELVGGLTAAMAAAGVVEQGPDLLAVHEQGLEPRLARRTAAVLSRRSPEQGLELLPHVDERGLEGLRELAERTWASGGAFAAGR